MKLFYLTEHTSCYNYFKFIEEGFRYYKFDTGLNHEEKLTKDCILFVVKGSLFRIEDTKCLSEKEK